MFFLTIQDVDDLKQVAELKERQYQTNLKNLQQ
jgi:hypothetical protein